MTTIRMTLEEARRKADECEVDWERIDAMTDEDIRRQIEEDPDVAPDMSELLAGTLIKMDVWGLRTRSGLSCKAFAERFGIDAYELNRWEAMGGVPTETERTLLLLIECAPDLVARIAAEAREKAAAPA